MTKPKRLVEHSAGVDPGAFEALYRSTRAGTLAVVLALRGPKVGAEGLVHGIVGLTIMESAWCRWSGSWRRLASRVRRSAVDGSRGLGFALVAVAVAGCSQLVSPAQPTTTVRGALPDGTEYELTVPATWDVSEIEGIGGGLVWDEGPPGVINQGVGITRWTRREHVGTRLEDDLPPQQAEVMARRLVIPAGSWAMSARLYEWSEGREDELTQIRGREVHGLPVLELPPALRWPEDGEMPVEMEVMYRSVRVVRGCDEWSVGRCSSDGRIRVVKVGGAGSDTDPDADLSGVEIRVLSDGEG